MKSTRFAFSGIVAALALLAVAQTAHSKVLAQWVQLVADGTSSVRAISDDACPAVSFDGTTVAMTAPAVTARTPGTPISSSPQRCFLPRPGPAFEA
jgi:hypothetical protein